MDSSQWLRGYNPNSYHPFRCFAPDGEPTTEGSSRANCTMSIGHTKEYTPDELHGAFVHAGFQIVHARTFSPYDYSLKDIRGKAPPMSLARRVWDEQKDRHGEVHFVVGRKVGCHQTARPCRRAFQPAYEFEDVMNEQDVAAYGAALYARDAPVLQRGGGRGAVAGADAGLADRARHVRADRSGASRGNTMTADYE